MLSGMDYQMSGECDKCGEHATDCRCQSKRVKMQKCKERGCRNLEWRCKDCGRVASRATFPKGTEWISVKDRLPSKADLKFGNSVIIFIPNYINMEETETGPFVGSCPWFENKFYYYNDLITHWMPLPKPPN